jgi:hypothetical protein
VSVRVRGCPAANTKREAPRRDARRAKLGKRVRALNPLQPSTVVDYVSCEIGENRVLSRFRSADLTPRECGPTDGAAASGNAHTSPSESSCFSMRRSRQPTCRRARRPWWTRTAPPLPGTITQSRAGGLDRASVGDACGRREHQLSRSLHRAAYSSNGSSPTDARRRSMSSGFSIGHGVTTPSRTPPIWVP